MWPQGSAGDDVDVLQMIHVGSGTLGVTAGGAGGGGGGVVGCGSEHVACAADGEEGEADELVEAVTDALEDAEYDPEEDEDEDEEDDVRGGHGSEEASEVAGAEAGLVAIAALTRLTQLLNQ
jgi:hypothetical protein